MSGPSASNHALIELVRARAAGDPYAFESGPQRYLARTGDGVYTESALDWNSSLLRDLAALARPALDPHAAARVGKALRDFLDGTGFEQIEAQILAEPNRQEPVLVSVRSGAAELYALPWALVTLRPTGAALGERGRAIVRLEWPDTQTTPVHAGGSAGRALFAWSSAGGAVPVAEHAEAIASAHGARGLAWGAGETLGRCSTAALVEVLERATQEGRPFTVLHLLCHGQGGPDGGALILDGEDGAPVRVDAASLRSQLAPFASTLRLVAMFACSAGFSGAPGALLGGVASALHRSGFAGVLSSWRPLTVPGSIELARCLWQGLLVRLEGLEAALASSVATLTRLSSPDALAIQYYARAEDGPDQRPFVLRPYRGLLPFEATQRDLFFGRATEIEALFGRWREVHDGPTPRLLVVAGASGAGKRSLLRAGLVPRLRAESLAGAPVRVARLDPSEPLGPQLAVGRAGLVTGQHLVWTVDPLDELWSEVPLGGRALIADALLEEASQPGTSVIATLRLDLVGRASELSVRAGRLDRLIYAPGRLFLLAPPEPQDLRAAIEGPATATGLKLEAGLVEVLLADAGSEPGALPLLQHALDQLWAGRQGRTLTHERYRRLGGLAGALAHTADDAIMALPPSVREIAWLILSRLSTADADGTLRRRQSSLADLQAAAPDEREPLADAIEALSDQRLVVVSGDRLELAHEALLRRWDALHRRAAAGAADQHQADEVLRQAEEWAQAGRDEGYLLRGARLGYAQRMAERVPELRRGHAAELIAASESARIEARRREEADLRERERLATAAAHSARLARDAALLAQARGVKDEDPTTALLLLRESSDGEQPAAWLDEAIDLLRRPICVVERALPAGAKGLDAIGLLAAGPVCLQWSERAARLLDVDTGSSLAACDDHPDLVLDASLSADGQRIATACADGRCRLWNAFGDLLATLEGPRGGVALARVSPDGQRALLASKDGGLALNSDGVPVRLPSQLGGVRLARWSANGARFATVAAGEDRTVRVWTAGLGSPVVLRGAERTVRDLAFDAEGGRIAVVGEDGVLRLWTASGAPLGSFDLGVPLSAVTWAAEGERLYVGDADGLIRALDLEGATRAVLRRHTEAITGLGIDPSGALHSTSSDGRWLCWRTGALPEDDKVPRPVTRHPHRIGSLALAGRLLASADASGGLRLAPASGAGQARALAGHDGEVTGLTPSPDGRWLVSAGTGGAARLWDLAGGQQRLSLEVDPDQVDAAAWCGNRLALGGHNGRVGLWALPATAPTWTWELGAEVFALHFTADGARLWCASRSGTVVLLDTTTGAVLRRLGEARSRTDPTPRRAIRAFAAGLGGLVLGAAGGEVLWQDQDPATTPRSLGRHDAPVAVAALTPEGLWAVSASEDGDLRVWNVQTGEPALRCQLDGQPRAIAVAARGFRVAIALDPGPDGGGGVAIFADDGVLEPLWLPLDARARAICLDATGDEIFIGLEDGRVERWPVSTASVRPKLMRASRCALSPQQRRALLGERRRLGEGT